MDNKIKGTKDLKSGYLVVTRNGCKHLVARCYQDDFEKIIVDKDAGYCILSNYNNELNNQINNNYDIIRVYGLSDMPGRALSFNETDRPLLWEREEYFNGRVVCIESYADYFTKGKIYEFKNGQCVDDMGDKRPTWYRIKTVKNLNDKIYSQFIEIVADSIEERGPKFKPGDVVRILDGSKIPNYHHAFAEEMYKYIGTCLTVKDVQYPSYRYPSFGYALLGLRYTWDERGLELVKRAEV